MVSAGRSVGSAANYRATSLSHRAAWAYSMRMSTRGELRSSGRRGWSSWSTWAACMGSKREMSGCSLGISICALVTAVRASAVRAIQRLLGAE